MRFLCSLGTRIQGACPFIIFADLLKFIVGLAIFVPEINFQEYVCHTLPHLFKKQKTAGDTDAEVFFVDIVGVPQSQPQSSGNSLGVPQTEPKSSRNSNPNALGYTKMSKPEYRFFNRTKLLADGLRATPLPHDEEVTQALERMERMHEQIRAGQTWRPCNRDVKAACQEAQRVLDRRQ